MIIEKKNAGKFLNRVIAYQIYVTIFRLIIYSQIHHTPLCKDIYNDIIKSVPQQKYNQLLKSYHF